MIYVQIMVRIALLMVSILGYILVLSKHVRIELTPGLTFSGIGALMFFAGLLNVLQEMAWCIFLAGILCLAYSLYKEEGLRKDVLCPGILFFGFAVVFFFLLLYGSVFENIDNFTHWGVASKVLLKTDFFPDLDRIVYRYPSYPVGSACIIYYVTKIIGIQSEWLQMWAQAMVMAGMISGLFVFAKQWRDGLIVAITSVMLLCSGVNFVDLLVDTLLPVTAISAFCFCICYREELAAKLGYLLPYTIFLVSIKNSGVLFALAVLIYALLSTGKKDHQVREWLKVLLITIAAWYLWDRHVAAVFGVKISTHNVSWANYQSVINSTTLAEKKQIVQLFLERVISEAATTGCLLANGVIIWVLSRASKNRKGIGKILAVAAAFYLVYQAGMLGMYLISMPKEEAAELAGYSRYWQTNLIFTAGLLVVGLMLSMEGHRMGYGRNAAIVVIVLCVFGFALQPNFRFYRKQSEDTSLELQDRVHAEALVRKYDIPEHGRYLILVSDDREDTSTDGPFRQVRLGYVWHLLEYMLDPSFITGQYASKVNPENLEEFDYVILFDETEAGRQLLVDAFGESEDDVICVYER